MNIRATLAEKKSLIIAVIVIAVGVAFLVYQVGGGSNGISSGSKREFFTIDDGKTWFVDDAKKIAPFGKDGKQAVLARVYRCSNGTVFVNHLERFTPEAKQTLETGVSDPTGKIKPDRSAIQGAFVGGREIKRPGDANWVNASNYKEASAITAIKPPNGGTGATRVEP